MSHNNKTMNNAEKRTMYLYGCIISAIITIISALIFCRPFYLDGFNLLETKTENFISLVCFAIFGGLSQWLFQQYKRLNVGIKGEVKTKKILSNLPEGYQVFANISIEYNGQKSEIDNLVISQKGIVIVETKSYNGILSGTEDDNEWLYTKTSAKGNQYTSTIRNPVKQVKRQTFILSNILKENGIHCWIDSYVFIHDGQCYVSSENIFLDERSLIHRIVSSGKDSILSDTDILKIKNILKSQQ